ncbi:LCP family protein [uncultured Kocuria sp.]|uniref:LCP family protein n=1 Tax=uncultured Kocuria sp. TaxID=259305 RepID=UPI002598084C|nr:LCP family protein [uncultured Kocuria sp.]MCT1366843.1 LCP family protein [Rothia sp. p3-SID1597]
MSLNDDLLDNGNEPQPRRRKKRRGGLIALGICGTLLLVGVIAVGAYFANLAHNFDSGTKKFANALPDDKNRPKEDGSYNVLLLGSDSRQGEADEKTVSGQRADTIMLLHVPADGGQAYLISIMRDTWVDIPGHGKAKINAALDQGGIPLEVQTIEQLLDTRIDHVSGINFKGFRDLTNSVGGVTVDVPVAFTTEHGESYDKGPQKMNGDRALTFVRERYAFADGDYQRVRDQRAYIRGLMKAIGDPQNFANPLKVNDMVKTFSPYVQVDDSLNSTEAAKILMKMGPNGFKNMKMMTLPNAGTGWSDDGQSIVNLDEGAVQELSKAMKDGTMDQFAKTAGTD